MEIWKNIDGFDGLYQVSNLGRFKSLRFNKERLLTLRIDSCGYVLVDMYKNCKKKTYIGHKIVALTFIPNPENKPQVNHINGIKSDNRPENLEWVTCSENIKHAYKTNLRNNTSKLTNEQIIAIKNDNRTQTEIAKDYNVHQTTISKIKKGF